MALLAVADYVAVRAALDVNMTDEDLPDARIALDIFQGRAEDDIIARYPGATAATGATLHIVTRAAVFYTAANIAGSLQAIVEEAHDDLRVRYDKVDWTARAAYLRGLAEAELIKIAPTETAEVQTANIPTMFTLATGRRGL